MSTFNRNSRWYNLIYCEVCGKRTGAGVRAEGKVCREHHTGPFERNYDWRTGELHLDTQGRAQEQGGTGDGGDPR